MPKSTRIVPKLLGCVTFGALLALSACENQRGALFVRGVIPATTDTTTGTCTVDPSTEVLLSGGTVDVGITNGFTLDLAVASQLIARANHDSLQAEVNRVTINRAEVRVTNAQAVRVSSFSSLVAGIVSPSADGATPGVGGVSVNVLEPAESADLLATIKAANGGTINLVAFVKLYGETLGGNDLETDFFQYPFTACAGCLVSFPPPTDGVVDCASATSSTTAPCRIGQNSPAPCSLCYPNEYCKPPT